MQVPILSSLRELDAAPRRFLLFSLFNVVSWQSLVGPAMILFARHIGMPQSWVGWLISFMPLSMLLVVLTVPLVMRFGAKPLMMAAWLVRNLVVCSVFTLPFAMQAWGPRAAWFILLGATLGFCVVRAIGAGGWMPWLHEVLREEERGAFFSTETGIAHLMTVGVILMQALILQDEPDLARFLTLYAVGVGAGLLSLFWMARVPGGRADVQVMRLSHTFRSYKVALHNRGFMQFILTVGYCFSCLTWLNASLVLFMRDGLGFHSRRVMLLMACGSFGVLLTIRFWQRFADHSGTGRAMFKAITGHAVAALLCLGLLPGAAYTPYLLIPLLMAASIFSAAFFMVAHRGVLAYVQERGRVGYTNIWTVAIGLSMGITPILLGNVIEYGGLWGFRACFAIAGLGGLAGGVISLWVGEARPWRVRAFAEALDPALPVRTLARIAWITVGLHESNRPAAATAPVEPQEAE